MQVKQVDGGKNGPRLWVAVLDAGEEVKATLVEFARREKVQAASFVALGAFKRAVIAYFDIVQKKYKPIPVEEQVEVIILTGDVVRDEKDEPDLHAHTVLGLPDGSTRGGICWRAMCGRRWKSPSPRRRAIWSGARSPISE
jgi:predicted DNA-binding protein with PD1-like motif